MHLSELTKLPTPSDDNRRDHRWDNVRSVVWQLIFDPTINERVMADYADRATLAVLEAVWKADSAVATKECSTGLGIHLDLDRERFKDCDVMLCGLLKGVHNVVDASMPNKDQNRAVKKLMQPLFDSKLEWSFNNFVRRFFKPGEDEETGIFQVDPNRY